MIVEKAKLSDKDEIYQLWKEYFAFDDGGHTDYYFKELYSFASVFVIKKDGLIVSTAQVQRHQMMLGGRLITYAFILGVVTRKEFQGRGYMKHLLNEILKQQSHQDLISVIQGYQPEMYYRFGFMPYYIQETLFIDLNKQPLTYNNRVDSSFDSRSLKQLYKWFTANLNGYRNRDSNYYQLLEKRLKSTNSKLICAYNEQKQLMGYLIYSNDEQLVIEEMLYYSHAIIFDLLAYLKPFNNEVVLNYYMFENLANLFNEAKVMKKNTTLIRINDDILFNKLYGTSDLMQFQPLYFNEYE